MIFFGLCLVGGVALFSLPIDLLPDIEPPTISVITAYPGANAADVEKKVTKVIEEELSAVSGVREITSISKDNVSVVTCQMNWGADLDEFLSDIRSRLELVKPDLPRDIQPPVVFKFDTAMLPVIFIAVSATGRDIRDYVDLVDKRISRPLMRLEGVGTVMMIGAPRRQVKVALDRARLDAYGVSLRQVTTALRYENLSLPAGNLKLGRADYVLRVPGEYQSLEQIRGVIIGRHGGGTVRLRDVAKVSLGFEERTSISVVNGKPILMLIVQKRSGANTVAVVRDIRKKLAEIADTIPAELRIVPFNDNSIFIKGAVSNLSNAFYLACALVVLIVLVFLREWRSSLIVALTIPASMIVAFAGLYVFGYTINIISLASMAVAVGMVVDNAIVAIENIGRHIQAGEQPREAAARGGWEVGRAVIASTVTTVSIFAPLVIASGIVGIMFRQLALVITVTLITSLAAALLLTPALSSRILRPRRNERSTGRRRGLVATSESAFLAVERGYSWLLDRALRHRKKVICGALVIFACSFLLLGVIGKGFVPKMDSGQVSVTIELPAGTRLERTAEVTQRIGRIMRQKVPEQRRISWRMGMDRGAGLGVAMGQRMGPNIATITVDVGPRSARSRSTFAIARVLRHEIEKIPGISNIEMHAGNMMFEIATRSEKPILVEILGDDLKTARQAGKIIKAIVEKTPGTVDVVMDIAAERPELRLEVDRDRASRLGVTAATIADTLRTAVHGKAVTRYRGEDEDIDVYVQLRSTDRRNIVDLEEMSVASITGTPVRLGNIARVTEGRTPVEIRHLDQQVVVRVSANVEGRSLGNVAADLEKAIKMAKLPPGVKTRLGGDVKGQQEAARGFILALAFGILLIYLVWKTRMRGATKADLAPCEPAFSYHQHDPLPRMPLVVCQRVPDRFTTVGGLPFYESIQVPERTG